MTSSHRDPPRARHRLNPDPVRAAPASRSNLSGCGPHGSYRHVHHQRGTVGTFHVRLLEGRGLERKHWSALSLGPARHLGLSRAHGEVSSFGTVRLAFWGEGEKGEEEAEFRDIHERFRPEGKGVKEVYEGEDYSSGYTPLSRPAASSTSSSGTGTPSTADASSSRQSSQGDARYDSFLPAMAMTSAPPAADDFGSKVGSKGKSSDDYGLSPLFDQGCLRSATPSKSPYFPSYATPQRKQPMGTINSGEMPRMQPPPSESGLSPDWDKKPSSKLLPREQSLEKMPTEFKQQSSAQRPQFGPPPPHHYAREEFQSSTVHNDSNPIWGSAGGFADNNGEGNEDRSTFLIPLRKDDLLPSLHRDGGKVGLEVRLDEEMAPTESLLVGGALSTSVGALTAATSVVGMGSLTQNVSNTATEMLGLGKDRLIGKGFVDLMPLLLGLWEEEWEQRQDEGSSHGGAGKGAPEDDDAVLDECGKIKASAKRMRRRVERMGLLDVWVPLYHPNSTAASNGNGEREDEEVETSGKVHLLISYEPNGMSPKRDDIVAFESFARRPLGSAHDSSATTGPVLTPIVPPLSPLLVIESKGAYLLLEYATSRTVTSVDRNGNVKSSRWERTHRVRIRRNAIFVVERRTLMDAVGSIARLPGDIVLSTPIGEEIAEVSAPIVAGAMELMGPAMLWGKLMIAAGGTGVKAGMVGLQAATSAVVAASQEKALERREGSYGERSSDSGAYGYGG